MTFRNSTVTSCEAEVVVGKPLAFRGDNYTVVNVLMCHPVAIPCQMTFF